MKDTMKERARLHAPSNAKALVVLVAVALVASFAVWGCSPKATSDDAKAAGTSTESTDGKTSAKAGDGPDELSAFSGFPTEGRFVDGVASLPDFYKNTEKNESNAKAEAPRRYTDRNGNLVQPVPTDELGWNNTYLDADNRGCTSCHTLENALMSLPTYHRLIFFGYPTEQSYQNCIACHSDSYSGHKLADAIHTLHMNSTMFVDDDNGNCQSCHYIDSNTGVFERWDEVKYDLYKGITDVASDELKASVTYDQTTITPAENRIFKTVKDEPNEWLTDDSKVDTSIYENWVISIDGDCENPVEMTLPEMEQQFGTVKQVMKMDCTINGVGQATIMQSEVEGIPLKAIIDYAKPKSGANVVSPIGSDGYDYAKMGIDWLLENDAVIVTKMDGELLPNSQGYPCMIDQEVRAGLHYARRLDVRVRKRVAQEPRSLPRRAGRQCRRSGVRGRRRVHRATNRDGRAAAHPRVSLSAEQLVHRVPGRPHGAGRGPRNLRRPRTPRGNGLRPARRCRRARARPAAASGLLVHRSHRRNRARRVRPGGEGGRRAA